MIRIKYDASTYDVQVYNVCIDKIVLTVYKVTEKIPKKKSCFEFKQ